MHRRFREKEESLELQITRAPEKRLMNYEISKHKKIRICNAITVMMECTTFNIQGDILVLQSRLMKQRYRLRCMKLFFYCSIIYNSPNKIKKQKRKRIQFLAIEKV